NAEDSLRKLGQRLRRGWERTRPVTPEEMEKVRQAVREQWEKEHAQDRSGTPAAGSPAEQSQQSQEEEQQRKARERSRDQDQTQ
ncbi:MAG: hypothetical protein AB7J34_24110, partial [Limisphaerales bacterium]